MFDFPATPLTGDEFTSGGVTYVYTGTVWDLKGGGSMSDYVLKVGDTVTGGLIIHSDPANGKMSLLPGDATNNGRIDWHNPDGTRKAYLGYAGSTTLQIMLDGATRLDIKGGSTFVDAANNSGYFMGDTWHGTYWNANKLIFTEYHDVFEWRRQTGGAQPGGDLRMTLGAGHLHMHAGSVRFGNRTANAGHNVSNHICLYSTSFGFGITGGTLNYVVTEAGNKHDFWVGTQYVEMRIDNTGVNLQPMMAVNEWLGRGADEMTNVKEVFVKLVEEVRALKAEIATLNGAR